jgi:preprotein translocase subunit SecE
MNRQHRRQIGRQGQGAAGDGGTGAGDGEADLASADLVSAALADQSGESGDTTTAAPPRARNGRGPAAAPVRRRVAPRQFLHEVNVELRKVAWPTRAETINYSTVVFITLAILMAMIFGLDLIFTKFAGFLFNP